MGKKNKVLVVPTTKPRNLVLKEGLSLLMKGGAHGKTNKAKRKTEKQALKKKLNSIDNNGV